MAKWTLRLVVKVRDIEAESMEEAQEKARQLLQDCRHYRGAITAVNEDTGERIRRFL